MRDLRILWQTYRDDLRPLGKVLAALPFALMALWLVVGMLIVHKQQ
jgi:hypothetical protein